MNRKRITSLAIAIFMMFTVFTGFALATENTYTVKSGDAIWKIAKTLGLDWKELAEFNNLKNANEIYPGQKLKIPGKEVVKEYTTEDLNEQLVMATLWMQKSAEYRALCYQAFNMGKIVLDADLKEESELPRAIVVDADETVIDNSAYEAHLVGQDYGYSSSTWTPWMNDAQATAIPGALEFLNYASEKGVEIFYITNRKMAGYNGTVENLKALGFPNVDETHMLLRTGSSDKEERRQYVKDSYNVVLYMGDNLNDFSSDFGGKSVEDRFNVTDTNKDLFGTEWIVLPNPTYGEWEGAIYNYNWGSTTKEKDEMRKDSLIKWNPNESAKKDIKVINLLTTNDFHGSLKGGYEAGAAKLKGYMDYYKSRNAAGTLILNAGDTFQGSPMSNLSFGQPVVEIMNEIGYDATAIGNHEFDWGIDKVNESMKNAKFPQLAANIYENGKVVDWAKPYTIIEKNGLKIGVIGLTTLETPGATLFENVKNYTFEDPIKVTNKLVPEVRKAGADIVVILSHIPAYQDRETGEITGELADLANGVNGVDAIVGGHSHKTIKGEVNGIPVVMAYKNAREIGDISLYFDINTKKVVKNEVTTHEVRKGKLNVEENAKVQAIVDKYDEELKPVFGEIVGNAKEAISRDYNSTSAAGNWFTDVMREYAKVDVALTNAGGIRSDIDAGEITMEEIYTIMPFDNYIVNGSMTGAQILEILEHGASLEKGMIQVSGLNFEYDSTKPVGERVISVTMADGTNLDPEKVYTVATNDFLSTGYGDGYTTFGKVEWENPYYLLREGLVDYIQKSEEFTPNSEIRAKDISQDVSLGFNLPFAA